MSWWTMIYRHPWTNTARCIHKTRENVQKIALSHYTYRKGPHGKPNRCPKVENTKKIRSRSTCQPHTRRGARGPARRLADPGLVPSRSSLVGRSPLPLGRWLCIFPCILQAWTAPRGAFMVEKSLRWRRAHLGEKREGEDSTFRATF